MPSTAQRHPTVYQSYADRSEHPNLNPLATYLLQLIHIKRTNLCVSADVNTTTELLLLAEDVGEHICMLKLHADIIDDFGDKTIRGLNEIAGRKKFLVFEDRKFCDIGNTLQQQYTRGPLAIVRWASVVNASLFPGPAVITALADAAKKHVAAHNTSLTTTISASPNVSDVDGVRDDESVEEEEDTDDETGPEDSGSEEVEVVEETDRKSRKQSVVSVSTTISTKTEAISPQPTLRPTTSRGSGTDSSGDDSESGETNLAEFGPPPYFRALLLLAQMSSAGNLFTPEYTQQCVNHARQNKDFVMGFIAQRSLNAEKDDNFITMTPGVQLAAGGDSMGQQYNTPKKVIGEGGSDVIIVGRGILAAGDRKRAAAEYRRQGWMAYEERLRSAPRTSRR